MAEKNDFDSTWGSMKIGEALQTVIAQARDTGRLTCGGLHCTRVLKSQADGVMLCVLREPDPTKPLEHIHQNLIGAFCRENHIKILHIDSFAKLYSFLQSSWARQESADGADKLSHEQQALSNNVSGPRNIRRVCSVTNVDRVDGPCHERLASAGKDADLDRETTETDCLLVAFPLSTSREDDFVKTYHDTLVYCHVTPLPPVTLPE